MSRFKKYEQDETQKLNKLVDKMNILYCNMGGRDSRHERIALLQCMRILQKTIEKSRACYVRGASNES